MKLCWISLALVSVFCTGCVNDPPAQGPLPTVFATDTAIVMPAEVPPATPITPEPTATRLPARVPLRPAAEMPRKPYNMLLWDSAPTVGHWRITTDATSALPVYDAAQVWAAFAQRFQIAPNTVFLQDSWQNGKGDALRIMAVGRASNTDQNLRHFVVTIGLADGRVRAMIELPQTQMLEAVFMSTRPKYVRSPDGDRIAVLISTATQGGSHPKRAALPSGGPGTAGIIYTWTLDSPTAPTLVTGCGIEGREGCLDFAWTPDSTALISLATAFERPALQLRINDRRLPAVLENANIAALGSVAPNGRLMLLQTDFAWSLMDLGSGRVQSLGEVGASYRWLTDGSLIADTLAGRLTWRAPNAGGIDGLQTLPPPVRSDQVAESLSRGKATSVIATGPPTQLVFDCRIDSSPFSECAFDLKVINPKTGNADARFALPNGFPPHEGIISLAALPAGGGVFVSGISPASRVFVDTTDGRVYAFWQSPDARRLLMLRQ